MARTLAVILGIVAVLAGGVLLLLGGRTDPVASPPRIAGGPAGPPPAPPTPAEAPALPPALPPGEPRTAAPPKPGAPLPVPQRTADAVFERLAAKSAVDLQNVHLAKALESFGTVTGVEFVFTSAALKGRTAEGLTIQSLRFEIPLSCRQTLDLICGLMNLAWEVRGEKVVLRAADEAVGDETTYISLADAKR